MRRLILCAALLLVWSKVGSALAEEPPPSPAPAQLTPGSVPAKDLPLHPAAKNPPRHKSEISDETFKFRASVDLPIALGAASTWILLAALQNKLSSSCRWCDRSSSGGNGLNGFDLGARRALKWHDTAAANITSDVSTFVAIPIFIATSELIATGSPHRWRRWAMDILIISEATAVSGGLDYIVKYAVSRQRPYIHYEQLNGVMFKSTPDDNASFFPAIPPSPSRSPPPAARSLPYDTTSWRPSSGRWEWAWPRYPDICASLPTNIIYPT